MAESSSYPHSYQEPNSDPNRYQERNSDPNSYQEPNSYPPNVYEEPNSYQGPDGYHEDDASNPISYIRDPSKLIAYLVPFPKPHLSEVDPATIPDRFLIYTPPPPPLWKPVEGEKEGKIHKVQRKWQGEVRDAKTSTAKTMSWKGIKSKALKGISWAVDRTTTTNVDFLGRVADKKNEVQDQHENDGVVEGETTKKTVGVEEFVLVYPSYMKGLGENQIREEFVNSMLRTKTKAERDAIISTALLPVSYGIDILATVVWPFGGLGEIDTVWAYTSIRGAKTARSVTKRLSSSSDGENQDEGKLQLTFRESERIQVLMAYLLACCHKQNQNLFPTGVEEPPTEDQVLSAIGWSPSEREKNWEDEEWERKEVQLDLKNVMRKGAKEWASWCKSFEKNPEKAVKK